MNDRELTSVERDTLRDLVEGYAEGGDFEAVWKRAHAPARARPSRLVAPLLLAAATLLVVGLSARDTLDLHSGAGRSAKPEAQAPWVEPYALRFEVAPPADAARISVKRAMETSPGPLADAAWDDAFARTPEAERAQLLLRRALVALHHGDLDAMRRSALASDLPTGRLMAAELYIVDLEEERAVPLLRTLTSDPAIGGIARGYLEWVDKGARLASIGELEALFALGLVREACNNAHHLWADPIIEQALLNGAPRLVEACSLQ